MQGDISIKVEKFKKKVVGYRRIAFVADQLGDRPLAISARRKAQLYGEGIHDMRMNEAYRLAIKYEEKELAKSISLGLKPANHDMRLPSPLNLAIDEWQAVQHLKHKHTVFS